MAKIRIFLAAIFLMCFSLNAFSQGLCDRLLRSRAEAKVELAAEATFYQMVAVYHLTPFEIEQLQDFNPSPSTGWYKKSKEDTIWWYDSTRDIKNADTVRDREVAIDLNHLIKIDALFTAKVGRHIHRNDAFIAILSKEFKWGFKGAWPEFYQAVLEAEAKATDKK